MELFKIFGSIVIDDEKAIKTLKEADKEARNNSKSLNEVENKLHGIGKAMVAAFSVAAITKFTKSAIENSAKLQAMDAQFEQVFGKDNQKMMSKVTDISKELNIHTDRLKASASQFGAQFKGAGMDATQAMTNTERALALASDGAAFYDKSLGDVSASMASLMKGNFAAGDAIGVFTNATEMSRISQEKFGLTWQKLTEAQKQDLLLQKIDETYQLNGAMGQAGREMNNWENVTGNLKATWERFMGTIGIPILEKASVVLNEVTGAIEWLTENLHIVIPVVTALTAAFVAQFIISTLSKLMAAYEATTKTMTFAQWLLNAAMNASPLGWIATLIGVVVAAGVALYMNWDKVKASAEALWASIKSAFGKIGDFVRKIWDGIKSVLKLPKISIKGKFSIIPPSVPKLDVKWNAEGAIFNKPTIFGTNLGYQGVGEAGAEAIAPIDTLLGYVKQSVAEENAGLSQKLDSLVNLLQIYMPQVLDNMKTNIVLDSGEMVGALAPALDYKFGAIVAGKERGR